MVDTSTHESQSQAGLAGQPEGSSWSRLLWGAWFVLLVLGLFGVWLRMSQGHLPAGYGSYVPWGLWIALYFHGVGISGGVFLIGALGYLLNLPGFRHGTVLRLILSLSVAAMVTGLLSVWFDLGRMDRAHHILVSPSFTSMMAFNAWMYNAFLGVVGVSWYLSYRPASSWLKPVLALGAFFALLFPGQSGALFGVVDAKPYWNSAIMPIMFLTSAITAGAATLLCVLALLRPRSSTPGSADEGREADVLRSAELQGLLRRVIMAGLCVYFVLEFAELSISLWSPGGHAPAVELVLFGVYWWVFWIIHLLLGGLLPLGLLASSRRSAWGVAAFLVAVTFLSTRLNVLVPGQAVGELKGLQEAFSHPRLSYVYHATGMEYLVACFLVAVGMAVFFLGRRISAVAISRFESRV